MLTVPLQPVPSQTLSVALGGQSCQINVYQLRSGIYADIYSGGALVVAGVLCENNNRLVRGTYLGFSGDLAFNDTAGTSDPVYSGLGSRYQLLYLTTADLSALGLVA